MDDATQPLTQDVVDPRRQGKNNSGLSIDDISDVMCILHPCTPAAFNLVIDTAKRSPQHVLQDSEYANINYETSPDLAEEQETFIVDKQRQKSEDHAAMDLALRFSSTTIQPRLGFVFGRNAQACDIVASSEVHKRVSNLHFCIYMNDSGVLMLQDMSTNGTMVDHTLLKHRTDTSAPQRHMLSNGSIIQILSPAPDEILKFVVRIPSREGYLLEYQAKFQEFMKRLASAQGNFRQAAQKDYRGLRQNAPVFGGANIGAPLVASSYGMHWSGAPHYNVVGHVGKGAFANVYKLATKSDGTLYAAKELEKRQFMKDGILDRRLDNEMNIMRAINHPNVVQYVDYQDVGNHLYIIMEYIPHGDLQQYLMGSLHTRGTGPMAESLAIQMAEQVLNALNYLHEQMITHRDIKPDNILIADLRPSTFTVKLSDFGLSKVVKNHDTFLRTFCGTLLYCAPEVFPHYDAHALNKGVKRARNGGPTQRLSSRSYSQAVDIWSFGAVLWYALCLKPPFEGVADKDGRGMFERIMSTPPGVADLVRQGVSDQAVALLVDMMNTDPAARPSPYDCLHHPWFGREIPLPPRPQPGLRAIAEEDSDDPDMSQLSIIEPFRSQQSEVSLDSADLDFFQSKRIKTNAVDYRDQESVLRSSGEMAMDHIPLVFADFDAENVAAAVNPKGQKLFGEISRSNLLAHETPAAQDGITQKLTPEEAHSLFGTELPSQKPASHPAITSPSLFGAEEMVRDMNMESPNASRKQDAAEKGHQTPATPIRQAQSQNANGTPAASVDETPKAVQPQFDRQIRLPITASYYWDPKDKSTHTLEYSSKVSGHDFVAQPTYFEPIDTTLAPTAHNSTANSTANSRNSLDGPSSDLSEKNFLRQAFLPVDSPRNPACYGKLLSTRDSFTPVTLEMQQRVTSWGRGPSNTIIYPDQAEVRIPKSALTIFYFADGLNDLREDQDWTSLPNLRTGIITHASAGIWVNGVHLKKSDGLGRSPTGRLRSGDEITICHPFSDGKAGMKFICEFYFGEAKSPRTKEGPSFVVDLVPTTTKGKQKEG